MKKNYITPVSHISEIPTQMIIATSEPKSGRGNDLGDGVDENIGSDSNFSGDTGGRGTGGTGNRVKGFYSSCSETEW